MVREGREENTEERKDKKTMEVHFSGNRKPEEPSIILSSSPATGYLATQSARVQVPPSCQQGATATEQQCAETRPLPGVRGGNNHRRGRHGPRACVCGRLLIAEVASGSRSETGRNSTQTSPGITSHRVFVSHASPVSPHADSRR